MAFTLTKRLYKEGTKEQYGLGEMVWHRYFSALDAATSVHLFETAGYEQDKFFSMPEWGRYVLTKFIDGKGLVEITIEEEE